MAKSGEQAPKKRGWERILKLGAAIVGALVGIELLGG